MKTSKKAFAKINLFLDIESRRIDGYHDILSYMQSITLHDTVSVEYISSSDNKKIVVTCDNADIPCDKRNIAYKAADAFPVNCGIINIHIEKKIPMDAGLAGGSADAAATLLSLNELFNGMLSPEELKSLGNTLGADVPFCIEQGACITKGTGDIMERTAALPDLPILVAKHGDGMSTPLAYAELDKKYNNFEDYIPNNEVLDKLISDCRTPSSGQIFELFNIFESVVEPQRPFVSFIKKTMKESSAISAMMSGSGTAVFGIFKDGSDAKRAHDILKSHNIESYICYPYRGEK